MNTFTTRRPDQAAIHPAWAAFWDMALDMIEEHHAQQEAEPEVVAPKMKALPMVSF